MTTKRSNEIKALHIQAPTWDEIKLARLASKLRPSITPTPYKVGDTPASAALVLAHHREPATLVGTHRHHVTVRIAIMSLYALAHVLITARHCTHISDTDRTLSLGRTGG